MTYNELAELIDDMTEAEKTAVVRVRVGECKDKCNVKDFRIGERSVGVDKHEAFFVI